MHKTVFCFILTSTHHLHDDMKLYVCIYTGVSKLRYRVHVRDGCIYHMLPRSRTFKRPYITMQHILLCFGKCSWLGFLFFLRMFMVFFQKMCITWLFLEKDHGLAIFAIRLCLLRRFKMKNAKKWLPQLHDKLYSSWLQFVERVFISVSLYTPVMAMVKTCRKYHKCKCQRMQYRSEIIQAYR